jgi:parallel beta-helix repeat protein
VGEREDNHELSEAEAMRHPRRNEVFRDVGSEEHAPEDADFIEVQRIPLEPDSALVLCSDGLSDQVASSQILRAVERNAGDPEAAVRELIGAANRAGGKDNVTVLVVEGDEFRAPTEKGGGLFTSRAALFVYGFLMALAAAWFSRSLWQPPAVVVTPRVLTAGTSIAAALAEARPGDTVEVAGGEYREQVRLKSGVHLRSRESAILRAAPLSNGPAVVAEGIQDARISGFRILADRETPLSTGILLVNSAVEVDDVEVAGAEVGIEIRGSANPVLRGNSIHDCAREGVLILGASAAWLSHNTIQRNKGAGLAARAGARPSLVGNLFEKNAVELPPEIPMDAVRERNFFVGERKK